METELCVCFCGKKLEKAKFSSHAQLCPTYREKKEALRQKAIELKKEGMTRKQIAKALTASLDPSSGVIISSNFVKSCFRKPKQKKAKATPAVKTTEQKLTLKEFLTKANELTFWSKLLKSGFLDEPMQGFVGHLFGRINSLREENQSLKETNCSLEDENEKSKTMNVVLCQKNKEFSKTEESLKSQIRALESQLEAARLQICQRALATNSEGSLVDRK